MSIVFPPLSMAARPLVCPACDSAFTLYTPKSTSYSLEKRDSDLCPHYKGLNPMFYQVWVCPSCSFASYKPHWEELPTGEKAKILLLSKQSLGMRFDFSRFERTIFAAILSYQLAYRCYQERKVSTSYLMGNTQMKLAWLCRTAKDLKREQLHLELAKGHLCDCFDREVGRNSAIDEPQLAFQLGEIFLRTNEPARAIEWYTRAMKCEGVINEINRMCKDQIFEARESLEKARQKETEEA
ncbi:MAG TPA: hypothetical protein DD435_00780 [Cyanobacteria bacterium UBA8530]|nr:hypothetical protein [Cyanobacteria bacterium UBA8530]